MKRLITVMIALAVGAAAPAFATSVPVAVVEFSPNPDTAGNWHYNPSAEGGILSFDQDVVVDRGLSSNDDALVGASVSLPTFAVGGIPGGPYTLAPLGSSEIAIKSPDNVTTYLTGTLGSGDLGAIGTVAGGYTCFQTDITDVTITAEGEALGSAALALIGNMQEPSLDFELSLQGGSGPGYYSFDDMLDEEHSGSGGFSGAMSVPEPATMALLSFGSLALMRRRRVLS
ncbi:MAG: PEP-CTERM sorting domain-containing protein [Phycisphaerales bacterium]|nr:MAG: PEP-CTERM sorting domain-containing protein [Phycisphaerales bacterium]